jgi:hypothetical protein
LLQLTEKLYLDFIAINRVTAASYDKVVAPCHKVVILVLLMMQADQ